LEYPLLYIGEYWVYLRYYTFVAIGIYITLHR
jgi:hypothetical protein